MDNVFMIHLDDYVELIETPGYECGQVAQALWYMSHDMSDAAKEQGFMPTLKTLRGVGFPEETDQLTAMLADPANVSALISELETFAEAHAQDRDLMRFQHYKPSVVLEQLRELTLPRVEYASELTVLPPPESFITEDEIAQTLSGGSNVEGSKGRIWCLVNTKRPFPLGSGLHHCVVDGGGKIVVEWSVS